MRTAVRSYGGFPLFEHKPTSLHPDPSKPALKVDDPRFDQRKRYQSTYYFPGWTRASQLADGFDAMMQSRATHPQRHAFTVEELHEYYSNWNWYEKYSWKFLLVETFKSLKYGLTVFATIFGLIFLHISNGRREMAYEPLEYLMDRDEFFDDYWWITRGHHIDKELYEAWLEKRRAALYRGVPYDDVKFHGKNVHEVEEWCKERRKQIAQKGKGASPSKEEIETANEKRKEQLIEIHGAEKVQAWQDVMEKRIQELSAKRAY